MTELPAPFRYIYLPDNLVPVVWSYTLLAAIFTATYYLVTV